MNERNNLYPIFLKTGQLRILVVGGGYVAEEKLHFLFKSSPDSHVTVLAPYFRKGTETLMKNKPITRIEARYSPEHLRGYHLVIATTDSEATNEAIYRDCRQRDILVNVADTPDRCDFYMGGIVTKGRLKVAISTNGGSPTLAKRLREFFETVLPDDLDQLVKRLHEYRNTIRADFETKVKEMNRVTQSLKNH